MEVFSSFFHLFIFFFKLSEDRDDKYILQVRKKSISTKYAMFTIQIYLILFGIDYTKDQNIKISMSESELQLHVFWNSTNCEILVTIWKLKFARNLAKESLAVWEFLNHLTPKFHVTLFKWHIFFFKLLFPLYDMCTFLGETIQMIIHTLVFVLFFYPSQMKNAYFLSLQGYLLVFLVGKYTSYFANFMNKIRRFQGKREKCLPHFVLLYRIFLAMNVVVVMTAPTTDNFALDFHHYPSQNLTFSLSFSRRI